jgi:hypothetical protein
MAELPMNDDNIYVLYEDCSIESTNAFVKLHIETIRKYSRDDAKHAVIKYSAKVKTRKNAYIIGGDVWQDMAESIVVYLCLKNVLFGTGICYMDKSDYLRATAKNKK